MNSGWGSACLRLACIIVLGPHAERSCHVTESHEFAPVEDLIGRYTGEGF